MPGTATRMDSLCDSHVCTVIIHGGFCYFMRVYPVLIAQRICCISIDLYEVLALVSHIKTFILTIT